MHTQTDLRHVIYALSDALDLVGIDDINHGKRVGIMAAECMRLYGARSHEINFMFDLGTLHDIGVSSTQTHRNLLREFDWEGSQEHCITGAALLQDFAALSEMAAPVLYHHTRWDKLVEQGVPEPVIWQANLILLADRVDVMTAPYYADSSMLEHASEIREQVQMCSGTYFAPELVKLFLATSKSEAFWLQLETHSIQRYLQDMLLQGPKSHADMSELRQLASIFAHIVDAKSVFTARHSQGVASLSRFLGQRMGVSPAHCDKIEIAGLLHDLGKLRIPDEILDKPGKLDSRERQIINTHSFETYQILRQIKGFEEITPWAAYHHEAPGGSGYPFHLMGETLPLEARILRVADIFQAMVQERPYRAGLTIEEVRDFMLDMAGQGKIDGDVVNAALCDLDETMRVALVV
ncbi:HD-GYP domain-containing protein [Uliginosibacterium gangwonense]|uniref:HD-GYP domain-containing protein n=1 Tax=Uliginosibacterium gangwonense TaxID=392736 RepID=UPI000364FB05|nr:HD domain-containing phosphohydrolase [Uliginosibacterium gangwonense]